jgi:hypothetical protein
MTAKDKAMEIAMKFDKKGETDNAKICALICVDEIINTYPTPWSSLDIDPQKDYWQEVKREIYKL